MTSPFSPQQFFPQAFLARLLPEIDDETVTTIFLHGSYARGDANPPFSDVDLVRITQETQDRKQYKKFFWRDSYLINLSTRPLSVYKEWLALPQEAIYRVSTIRDAHILLEKDRTFRTFQQEIRTQWTWEPLQPKADAYAGQLLAELSEVILRTIGAVQSTNTPLLVERMYLHILPAVTEAVGVQRGILATGNAYVQQIQQAIGYDSTWTHLYMQVVAGQENEQARLSLPARGMAALRLYRETIRLLFDHLSFDYQETIRPLLSMIDRLEEEVS